MRHGHVICLLFSRAAHVRGKDFRQSDTGRRFHGSCQADTGKVSSFKFQVARIGRSSETNAALGNALISNFSIFN